MTTVVSEEEPRVRLGFDRQTLTIREAAVEYGVSDRTIRRYIADGLIRSSQALARGAIRIHLKEWERFLRTRQ